MAANNPNSIDDQIESLRVSREEMQLTQEVMAQNWSQINGSISSVMQKYKDINRLERDMSVSRRLALQQQKKYNDLMADVARQQRNLTQEEQEQVDAAKKLSEEALKKLDADGRSLAALKSQLSMSQGIWGSLKNINSTAREFTANTKAWLMDMDGILGGINDSDKAIRQLNLSLGNSGNASDRMRDSFIESGAYAAKFGMNVRDLTVMQGRYADLTGKINGMSAEQSKWMVRIANGTNLGAEGAAQMAANFEIMGVNAARVGQDVEYIVNESAAMGLNASSVLKDMNDNFARSQEFSFVRGRAGLKDMALNAQKMKISMESTFAAADKARTLKGSLDMASQLMVMGGKFSQADPFQLSFLARNDPAKFTESIAGMTEGMVSFNKATGELGVNAYDMDRLRAVSEATNIPLQELVKSATSLERVSRAKKSLFVGSNEDREMIAQMATMQKDGSFTVNVGGADVALNKLSTGQISLLKAEKTTLEARARDSQAFDELYKNSMMELKAVALPFLVEMSSMLKWLKSFIDGMDGGTKKMIGMVFLASQVAGKVGGVVAPLLGGIKTLGGMMSGGGGGSGGSGGGGGGFLSKLFGRGGNNAPTPTPTGGNNGGSLGGKLAGAGGMSTAATLAAIGVAAVGMGYGIKLATEGISKLAVAMKGMTGPEIAGLVGVVAALSLGFVAMAVGVAAFANPASLAGVAVVAGLGLSMVAMGYAIKLATEGIGTMFQSVQSMAGLDLSGVGAFFDTAANFLAADSTNFVGLMATVAYLKSAQTNLAAQIQDVMNTPIQLKLANDSKMVVNVEVHTNLDGDKFTKKFSKPFSVELQKAAQGIRSLIG